MPKAKKIQPSYITPSQHEKQEWARMAQDAYRTCRNFYGHRYSSYAALKNGQQIELRVFDILQRTYRDWLTCGWPAVDGVDQARWEGTR